MKRLPALFILILFSKFSFGQNFNFFGGIPSYSQTGLISKKFDYNLFASATYDAFRTSYRGVEYPAKLLQVYIQPSIIYKYNANLNFAASITYNYQRSNPDVPYFNEWRTWQQVIYNHTPFKYKGRLAHRVRYEQRFIKNIGDQYKFSDRLRYQIGYMVPLEGRTLDAHEFYFNAYNEFYFTLSNPPERPRSAFYSEDWAYIGVGYHTGKMGRLEAGPLYQTNVRNRNGERRNLILLQVMWMTNFNVKFKKKSHTY
jgi:hypothetical protein